MTDQYLTCFLQYRSAIPVHTTIHRDKTPGFCYLPFKLYISSAEYISVVWKVEPMLWNKSAIGQSQSLACEFNLWDWPTSKPILWESDILTYIQVFFSAYQVDFCKWHIIMLLSKQSSSVLNFLCCFAIICTVKCLVPLGIFQMPIVVNQHQRHWAHTRLMRPPGSVPEDWCKLGHGLWL